MPSADRWCLGMPPQPPHVPNDGRLIVTPAGVRLCCDCFRRWNGNERGEP
jgi:hypothetical protein